MKTVTVRNLVIGSGTPKICVPIVGNTQEEILQAAKQALASGADLAEWRADWYDDIFDLKKTDAVLRLLRDVLGEMPLLFTFRTAKEGGEKNISPELYVELNCLAIASGCIDLVDAELFLGSSVIQKILSAARAAKISVIISNHDFQKTPPKEELLSRLCKMQELGADILKIAVMPRNREDVFTLLSATEEMVSRYANRPVITMSMSGLGLLSRLCGELSGSALTFASAGKASAPGQIPVGELKEVLHLLHKNLL